MSVRTILRVDSFILEDILLSLSALESSSSSMEKTTLAETEAPKREGGEPLMNLLS